MIVIGVPKVKRSGSRRGRIESRQRIDKAGSRSGLLVSGGRSAAQLRPAFFENDTRITNCATTAGLPNSIEQVRMAVTVSRFERGQ